MGGGNSSVVEPLTSMYETVGSIASTLTPKKVNVKMFKVVLCYIDFITVNCILRSG